MLGFRDICVREDKCTPLLLHDIIYKKLFLISDKGLRHHDVAAVLTVDDCHHYQKERRQTVKITSRLCVLLKEKLFWIGHIILQIRNHFAFYSYVSKGQFFYLMLLGS